MRSIRIGLSEESPEYAQGLRRTIAAALEHALTTIELGEEHRPLPQELLAQARLAAREGVGIDALYRRYVAGHSLITDFLLVEARSLELPTAHLQSALRSLGNAFDQLLEAIATEHARETQRRLRTQNQRKAERVERLLRGEPAESAELAYELDAHHLALVARGRGVEQAIRATAAELECRALIVRRSEGVIWAWLGSRRELDPAMAASLLKRTPSSRAAIGESAHNLAGWRLTHRQARAAFRVAQDGAEPIVRYAEVILLAAALQDELLANSLRALYLQPLLEERDGGKVALQTLRAYFQTGRNVSSAAALLGVSRRAVAYRLRAIGGRLGGGFETRAPEIELALKLGEIERGERAGG